MKGYHKLDVDTHSERYGRRRPAINVKVYHYPRVSEIVKRLGWQSQYDNDETGDFEKAMEKAMEFAFESAQEDFWQFDTAQDIAERRLGRGVKVYSEGRSGGWLVVHGWYEDVDSWDAITLHKWALFERDIHATVKYLSSLDYVAEMIECNGWVDVDSFPHDLPDEDEGGADQDTRVAFALAA